MIDLVNQIIAPFVAMFFWLGMFVYSVCLMANRDGATERIFRTTVDLGLGYIVSKI
jgi:hypothetical protein